MIEINYEIMRNPVFARGIHKLVSHTAYPPLVGYNISKLQRRLVSESKICDRLFKNLVEKYAKKDELGKISPHEGRPGSFTIPEENEAAWDRELKEFGAIKVEIDCHRTDIANLEGVGLSPLEMDVLEPVLSLLD